MNCSTEGPASCDLSTWVQDPRGRAAPPDYQVRLTRASQEPRLSSSFTPSPLCQACPEGGAQDTFACREQDTQRAGSPQRRQAPRRRTRHPSRMVACFADPAPWVGLRPLRVRRRRGHELQSTQALTAAFRTSLHVYETTTSKGTDEPNVTSLTSSKCSSKMRCPLIPTASSIHPLEEDSREPLFIKLQCEKPNTPQLWGVCPVDRGGRCPRFPPLGTTRTSEGQRAQAHH
ncbi:uncharacterized protein [Physeter macrocephalus]|uniref:Uncharacterized protein n=1 Tax=Physeter macrocephalus TaxID=9755 RepID=A0A455BYY3_PHYMC|nr:uncharacterized protein LOC114487406 [Physeter catodon]|eukprot:XP_028352993.1 uncharacterized protein LOC114487406 [Physeter catodon]